MLFLRECLSLKVSQQAYYRSGEGKVLTCARRAISSVFDLVCEPDTWKTGCVTFICCACDGTTGSRTSCLMVSIIVERGLAE